MEDPERLEIEASERVHLVFLVRFADSALQEGGVDLAAAQHLQVFDRAGCDLNLQLHAFAGQDFLVFLCIGVIRARCAATGDGQAVGRGRLDKAAGDGKADGDDHERRSQHAEFCRERAAQHPFDEIGTVFTRHDRVFP